MGQSLAQLYIHLTFATKYRKPLIKDEIREALHGYMAGIFKNHESPALIINSVPDHIHVLFRLSKNKSLASVVEAVKKDSSKWMKEQGVGSFKWQGGYGAFSVSEHGVEPVKRYIENQQEHHKVKTFKEELEEFFEKYDISDYSEEYFWR